MIKYAAFLLLIFIAGSAVAEEQDIFEKIERNFDPAYLFDQRTILEHPTYRNASEEKIDEALVAEFLSRKRDFYKSKCWENVGSEGIALLTDAVVFGGVGIVAYTLGLSGIAGAVAMSGAFIALVSPFSNFVKTSAKCWQKLYSAKKHDPIERLEKEYVRKKRFFTALFQTRIESELVSQCRNDFTKHYCIDFVQAALSLPTKSKRLIYDEKRFSGLVAGFTDQLRDSLKAFYLKQVVEQSKDAPGLKAGRKVVAYFHGLPGTGKTTAARRIAEALGLPYKEVSLAGARGTHMGIFKLTGAQRFSPDAGPGLIASAMAELGPDGNPSKNMVLIINDGDRAINEPGPNPLKDFMRELTDPEFKLMKNDYFGIDVDISRLIIILTGNEEITDASIRNRLYTLEFPLMNVEQKKQIIFEQFIPDYMNQLEESVQPLAKLTKADNEKISRAIKDDKDAGIRTMQQYVTDYIANKIKAGLQR